MTGAVNILTKSRRESVSEMSIVNPVDLNGLAPFVPATLRPVIGPRPGAAGSRSWSGPRAATARSETSSTSRSGEESLTAYEVSYTGTLWSGGTIGATVYLNRRDDRINFVPVLSDLDPYTARWPRHPLALCGLGRSDCHSSNTRRRA